MKTPLFTSTFGLHLHSIIRLFDYSIILSLAALALSAPAAEVVVYSPYCKDGLTVSAPSGVYRFPAAYTGHRAVVRIPDASGTPVEAWTGNGDFSPSAAYGTTAGRNEDVLDLTLHSPIMPRLTVSSPVVADRGGSIQKYYDGLRDLIFDADVTDAKRADLLDNLGWFYTNRYAFASPDASSTEKTRVRVVRWLVDGQPVYRIGAEPQVVLDKRMLLSDRAFLTEADVLADSSSFDLDWAWLKDRVVDYRGVQLAGCEVTNVAYLVVIGDGSVSWRSSTDTNSCPKVLDYAIERRYSFERASTRPVNTNAIVRTARPTLRWTIVDAESSPYTGYTAFQLQVLPPSGEGETNVWASGTVRLPPPDENGVYSWTLPVAAGDLEECVNYRWRVCVLNAKFPTPTWSAALTPTRCFRIDTGDTGKLDVCVRYFGSKTEVLDQGTVRVEAFDNADFSGVPAARVSIVGKNDEINSATAPLAAQATIQNLKAASPYYLRAFIDNDTYGTEKVLDDWESSGVCRANTNMTAASVAVATSGDGPVYAIYIGDADTNGNGFSDALEMYRNGGTLDNGAQNVK